jgi:uncharacterized membrane protein
MVLMVAGAGLALTGSTSPARVLLGIAAVLFIPGYLLVGALFPAWSDLSLAIRLGVSVVVSVALQAFLGAFLGWGPWGIHQPSVLGVSTAFVLVVGVGAVVRALGATVVVAPGPLLVRRRLAFALPAIVVAGLVLWGAHHASQALITTPPFTEFYVASTGDQDAEYPTVAAPGDTLTITLGIENNEQRPLHYHILVQDGDQTIGESPIIPLNSGERWTGPVTFHVMPDHTAGTEVPIAMRLLVEDNHTYTRELRFWLTMNSAHP